MKKCAEETHKFYEDVYGFHINKMFEHTWGNYKSYGSIGNKVLFRRIS